MRTEIQVPTKRGVMLDGVLFHQKQTDTVLIAITGIKLATYVFKYIPVTKSATRFHFSFSPYLIKIYIL